MRFGARVLGEKEFEKEQQANEEARQRGFAYGPRVTGPATTADEAPAKDPKKPVAAQQPAGGGRAPSPPHLLSVKELEKALKGDPSEQLLDELIAAEFERPEGQPRKGALRLLLQAEEARGEQARKPIIAQLEKALEA